MIMALLVALNAAGVAAGPLTLAADGKSDYAIIIPSRPAPAEARAARELQTSLYTVTGVSLPIRSDHPPNPSKAILLGNPQNNVAIRSLRIPFDAKALGDEGYVMRTVFDTLVLGGMTPRATMYAAYGFLEDVVGCRWYGAEATVMPKRRTLTVTPMSSIVTPAFEYREPFYTEAWDKDWAARNRCNGTFMQLDEETGGKIGYHPFVHTFWAILPPDQYFAQHPEYYSELDGVRKVEGGQLCLTNPEVLRLTVECVRRWIREHPEARIFSVSQNDWYGCCQCAECKKVIEEEGAQSGLVLRFVNAVAEQVCKDHPEKLIDTLAYQWTEQPPAKVRPHTNVRVRMAPIGNCFGHPIDGCERNKKPFENLLAWAKITDNLYIWHYNTNFAHYLAPFPDFDELQGSTRAYKKLGVKGIFYEGAYPRGGGSEFAELRSWVLAKLLWDPSRDVWKLVDEFVNGYYGKAARPIRDYLRLLHDVVKKENIHFGIYDHPKNLGYLRKDLVDKAEALFAEAERLAAGRPELERVQKARLAIDYTRLAQAETPEERAKYADVVAEKIRRFGIHEVREGQPVEHFLQSIGK